MQVLSDSPVSLWWSSPNVCPTSWQITCSSSAELLLRVGASGAAEVVVVQLHYSLRDMATAAVDPDLRDTEPARIAIVGVAHLDATQGGVTRRAVLVAGDNPGIQHRRLRPVARHRREHAAPRLRRVVAEVDRERVGCACPVVLAPGMTR